MHRLSSDSKIDIIYRYRNNLSTMIELAKAYKITRQAIYKIIKAADVEISKAPVLVSCNACGKDILRGKTRIRKNVRNFCNKRCYTAFLETGQGFGNIVLNRQGTRIARSVVMQHFDLQPSHVVHHKDRNQLNNEPQNLMVFKNQGDHTRWHRGLKNDVLVLWDGEWPR